MTTGTELQAAIDTYQAACEATFQTTVDWEDAKQAETAARLAMNQAAKNEEDAAAALLAIVQEPGLLIRPAPEPEPAPAEEPTP